MYSWQMASGQRMNYNKIYRLSILLCLLMVMELRKPLMVPLLSAWEKRIMTRYI
jgi:hypothetical protein